MLSTNIITHYAILRDDTKIPLTEDQYNKVEFNKVNEKWTFLQKIIDPNNWQQLYNGEIGYIKGFQEVKRKDMTWIRFVCDFWTKHVINEECFCWKKYNTTPIIFRQKMVELFPNLNSNDLTDEQRMIILKAI